MTKMSNAPELLHAESLSIDFPEKETGKRFRAVDGLSFSIHEGEIVGVVGESGSGKSVTSLSIMRLLKKAEYCGHLWFHRDGRCDDLLSLSNKQMCALRGAHIGMIFQEPMTSLNPSMRCGRQIAESLRIHRQLSSKEAEQEVLRLFEQVRLPDPKKTFRSYPHEISGGQKQRVMIAMAIACRPRLLIADEPTTALDVTVQKAILELLKQLRKDLGISILFISHDLGVVANIADRAIVMYKGKKMEEGPIRELFLHPQHPYTKGLLACRVPLDKRYEHLPTVQDFLQAGNNDPLEKRKLISDEQWRQEAESLQNTTPLLDVRHLCKFYPLPRQWGKARNYFHAVDDISFQLYKGETLGLVGESGCGKTTLGRSILRLIEPSQGEIIYKGKDIRLLKTNEMRELRKEIQIIFQDPYSSLNPRFTAGMAIMEPMKLHRVLSNDRERKDKVVELLEQVDLQADDFYHYPHEFSGGQRQRICIARALALKPQLIVCDESVSALDVSVQAQVLNLLKELKKHYQFTYIFISHDLSVVKYMSHRVLVMQKGRMEELQAADELYRHPQSEYTQHLLDAVPKIDFL